MAEEVFFAADDAEVFPDAVVLPVEVVFPAEAVFPVEAAFPEAAAFPVAAVLPSPVAASSSDFCVTPRTFAIFLITSCVGSFSPRSTLLTSEAVSPSTCSASAACVNPFAVRASFTKSPSFLDILTSSFTDKAILPFQTIRSDTIFWPFSQKTAY